MKFCEIKHRIQMMWLVAKYGRCAVIIADGDMVIENAKLVGVSIINANSIVAKNSAFDYSYSGIKEAVSKVQS